MWKWEFLWLKHMPGTEWVEILFYDTKTFNVGFLRNFTTKYTLLLPECLSPHLCLEKYWFFFQVTNNKATIHTEFHGTLNLVSHEYAHISHYIIYMEWMFLQRNHEFLESRNHVLVNFVSLSPGTASSTFSAQTAFLTEWSRAILEIVNGCIWWNMFILNTITTTEKKYTESIEPVDSKKVGSATFR